MSELIERSILFAQADTAANLLQELIIHRRGPKLDNELRADVQVAQQTIIKMASRIKELEQQLKDYHAKNAMKLCPHGYPQTVRCSRCGE